MKIHELRAELLKYDQDLEVVISVPAASEYGWEIKEGDVKFGDWNEGHFFSHEKLQQWRDEMPAMARDETTFTIKNPVVGLEVGPEY